MLDSALMCLAVAIFHEGRGETQKGQYAIAEVIHNRTQNNKFPSNYCDVIKQKGQFSFYKNPNSLKPPTKEKESWEEAKEVAKNFSKKKTNYTKGAVFFNTNRLGVRFKPTTIPCRIGGHTFY